VEEPSTGKYFFALSPEDEIEQAVSYFVKKDIQYPAIIYADNSLGRRLSKQFSDLWLATTEKQLESIAFQSKSKLGQAVKDLLDVGLSEQRIKQIKTLLGAQIKSEERSRTDIDAIYVIANSQQTRLIKPFFDVNVSKFAKQLPIYASSRSYVVGESRNQKLDLNGLTFTEMPWIVNGKNTQLNKVYEQIGDKNTQSKKLFAFGYDSFKLIPILNHLAILPEVAVESLTGTLKIDKTGRIKRNLEWAQYRQGNVVIVKTNRN
jgi:outer membrane PBP1 activator LpoA protein